MSQESAKAFYQKIAADAGMAERYKAVLEGNQKGGRDALAAAAVSFGRAEGFDFTVSELEALAQEMKDTPLSDEQLEAVAGGGLAWGAISAGSFQDGTSFMCFIAGYSTK